MHIIDMACFDLSLAVNRSIDGACNILNDPPVHSLMREGIASFEKYIQYLSSIFLSFCDLGMHNAILISLSYPCRKLILTFGQSLRFLSVRSHA